MSKASDIDGEVLSQIRDTSDMKEKIINILKIIFLYSARYILQIVPLKVLHFTGDIIGSIMVGKKDRIMREDLTSLLGDMPARELDGIMRRTLQNFRKDLFEIWTFPKLNQKRINRMAYFEGKEHLDSALSKGKGVILCITHFGSWKIILPAMGYNSYKVNQVAANPLVFVNDKRTSSHNKIMQIERDCESSLPVNFIYINNHKSIRPIYRALENNEVVVISLDGMMGGKRMNMPFLNDQLQLSTTGVSLSLSTGAPALPVFTVRQNDERHKIVIHESFYVNNSTDKENYIAKWMEWYKKLFEQYVIKHPDHYVRFLYLMRKFPFPVPNIKQES
jgi:KDO2-lipid IV(A) lauroyltransferase